MFNLAARGKNTWKKLRIVPKVSFKKAQLLPEIKPISKYFIDSDKILFFFIKNEQLESVKNFNILTFDSLDLYELIYPLHSLLKYIYYIPYGKNYSVPKLTFSNLTNLKEHTFINYLNACKYEMKNEYITRMLSEMYQFPYIIKNKYIDLINEFKTTENISDFFFIQNKLVGMDFFITNFSLREHCSTSVVVGLHYCSDNNKLFNTTEHLSTLNLFKEYIEKPNLKDENITNYYFSNVFFERYFLLRIKE